MHVQLQSVESMLACSGLYHFWINLIKAEGGMQAVG